jgi:hypothetical protein
MQGHTQNQVVSVGGSGNAGAWAYLLYITISNNIKKFRRKIVGALISW